MKKSNPETHKVVTEQLHNQCRVLVALLAQGIELCGFHVSITLANWKQSTGRTSNSVVKCLLGQVASLVRGVEDFVVEN